MSIPAALARSRAPAAALAAVGVFWGGFAALVPDIKADVGASDWGFGKALLMSALGGMLAMLVAPRAGRELGRIALPLLGAVLCLAAMLPALPASVFGLGAAMLAVGASVALLDITANVEISAREARGGLHLMNVNHAMFSLAFAASAYGTGLARQAGHGPDQVLPVLSAILVLLVAMMWQAPVARAAEAEEDGGAPRRPPWLAIGLTGVILFTSFVGENATEAWSALHIERTLGAAAGHGSFGPAMLGLVMGIGRLAGQTVADRLGHARLISWSAALAVAGTLVIAAAPSVPVAIAGVSLGALGLAVIVPSGNSMLGAHVTEVQRAHALSRAWMVGIVGFFFGPAMMGGVAELFGLRASFATVALLVSASLPAVWLLDRQPRR